jgi:hypothetical protein
MRRLSTPNQLGGKADDLDEATGDPLIGSVTPKVAFSDRSVKLAKPVHDRDKLRSVAKVVIARSVAFANSVGAISIYFRPFARLQTAVTLRYSHSHRFNACVSDCHLLKSMES